MIHDLATNWRLWVIVGAFTFFFVWLVWELKHAEVVNDGSNVPDPSSHDEGILRNLDEFETIWKKY